MCSFHNTRHTRRNIFDNHNKGKQDIRNELNPQLPVTFGAQVATTTDGTPAHAHKGPMDDTLEQCFAAFDREVCRAYTWAYTDAVARATAPVPPDATGALCSSDLDAVLPPLVSDASPAQTPRHPRPSHRRTLPYDDSDPDGSPQPLAAALEAAWAHGALHVRVQDWAVLDADVEPFIAVLLRATLGDFEAVTYRTLDDFRALHAVVGREVDSQGAEHGTRVAFPAHLSSLARAALASRPLKSKAPRFDCVCRRRTGLERPHDNDDGDDKNKDKSNKSNPAGTGTSTASSSSSSSSVPRRACHCGCGYCCWGDAAAEMLGVRLQSYVVALGACVRTPPLLRWLGFDARCVSLASRTHGPGSRSSRVSAPAAAAIALRTLHAATTAAVERAARTPAFRAPSQAALYFNTPDEGLRAWTVAEALRRGGTWLPGATPAPPLTREQRRERDTAKATLSARVRSPAHRRALAALDRLEAFSSSSAAKEDDFRAHVLAPLASPGLATGVCEAAQCVARIVGVLLERHVLTRAVVEPLANVDAQLALLVADDVYCDTSLASQSPCKGKWNKDKDKGTEDNKDNGKWTIVGALMTGTRLVASGAVSASAHAFAAGLAGLLAAHSAALRPLLAGARARGAAAAQLACVPTLVRAALHVALCDAPAAFAPVWAAAVRAVRAAPPAAHARTLAAHRAPLVRAWRTLHQALRTAAWRAGYLLEKSLLAQHIQQSAVLKGGGASSASSAASASSTTSSATSASASSASEETEEESPAIATPHPYTLGFAMESVRRHLHALGDATAAACWCAVIEFAEALRAAVHTTTSTNAEAQWPRTVERAAVGAFARSFARLKAQLGRVTVSMLMRFVCDVLALGGGSGTAARGRKDTAATACEGLGDVLQPDAVRDVAVAHALAHAVHPVLETWADSARERYAVVLDAVVRDAAPARDHASDDAGAEPLSLGSDSYSGSGSFTSEDDEDDDDDEEEIHSEGVSSSESFLSTAMSASSSCSNSSNGDDDEDDEE